MKNQVTGDEMAGARKAANDLATATRHTGSTTTSQLAQMRQQAQEVLAILQNLEATVRS